jgi:hypothetical protein
MTLFTKEDGVELEESGAMSSPQFADGDLEAILGEGLDLTPGAIGNRNVVLFRGEGEDGFSLVRAWFAPDYVLPRHSHSANCLYFVDRGSVLLGSRVVSEGGGFFVPDGAPYAVQAGPEGAVVLEFRDAPSFDMKMASGQMDRYRMMAEVGATHRPEWKRLLDEERQNL